MVTKRTASEWLSRIKSLLLPQVVYSLGETHEVADMSLLLDIAKLLADSANCLIGELENNSPYITTPFDLGEYMDSADDFERLPAFLEWSERHLPESKSSYPDYIRLLVFGEPDYL